MICIIYTDGFGDKKIIDVKNITVSKGCVNFRILEWMKESFSKTLALMI